MCWCGTIPCKNCGLDLYVHIGDFSCVEDYVEPYCHKCTSKLLRGKLPKVLNKEGQKRLRFILNHRACDSGWGIQLADGRNMHAFPDTVEARQGADGACPGAKVGDTVIFFAPGGHGISLNE